MVFMMLDWVQRPVMSICLPAASDSIADNRFNTISSSAPLPCTETRVSPSWMTRQSVECLGLSGLAFVSYGPAYPFDSRRKVFVTHASDHQCLAN